MYGIANDQFLCTIAIGNLYFWQDLRKTVLQNMERKHSMQTRPKVQIYFHTFHGQRFLEKDIVDVSIYKSRTQSKNQKNVRTFIQLDSIFHFVRWVTVVPYFRCFAENLDGDVLKKSPFIHMFRFLMDFGRLILEGIKNTAVAQEARKNTLINI